MTTIETKIAKNGTQMFYVNGKRTNRDNAIEAATANRCGATFTVEYSAYNTKVGAVTENTITVDNLNVGVRGEAHSYDMIFGVMIDNIRVASTAGYKTDADAVKSAKAGSNVIANAIVAAYINGARGVKIVAGRVEVLPAAVIEVETAEAETVGETVAKFEVGKTYYGVDFEDAPDSVKTLTVIKRTAKTLTAIDETGNQVVKRIELGYAGTKELVSVLGINDITAQSVNIYADKEYVKYKPQCAAWKNPHNYETVGNISGTPRSYNFDADNYANVIFNATVEEYAVTTAAFDGAILCEMHNARVASGTYNITINGEYVSFKNHSIVRIDATRERQMYLEKDCKGRNRFYVFNPGHGQEAAGADDSAIRISASAVAERYMAKEAAKEQGKKIAAFFAPYRTRYAHEFTVWVCLTYVDGREHTFTGEFNQYRQVQHFISDVKEFVGETPCQIFIKTRDHRKDAKATWENPHNYETVGSPHARNVGYVAEPATVEVNNVAEHTPAAGNEEDEEITVNELKVFSAKLRGLSFAEFAAEEAGMTVEEYNAKEDAERINLAKRELNWHVDEQKAVIRDLENDLYQTARALYGTVNADYYEGDDEMKAYAIELEGEYNDIAAKLATCKAELATVKAAIAADKNIAIEETTENAATAESELPKGDITVESGAEAWAIVGKYFPEGIKFSHVTKGFNRETRFSYTNGGNIFAVAGSTADDKRIEYIEVVNANESGSARKPLTVYIKPATGECKPQCTWGCAHKYETVGADHARNVGYITETTAAEEDRFMVTAYYSCTDAQGRNWNGMDDGQCSTAQTAAEWFINFAKEHPDYIIKSTSDTCIHGKVMSSIYDRDTYKEYGLTGADIAALKHADEAAPAETVIETKITSNNNIVVKLNGKRASADEAQNAILGHDYQTNPVKIIDGLGEVFIGGTDSDNPVYVFKWERCGQVFKIPFSTNPIQLIARRDLADYRETPASVKPAPKPSSPSTDDFAAKLAALKAKQADAKAKLDEKTAAREQAQKAVEDAHDAEDMAYIEWRAADDEVKRLLNGKAKELTDALWELPFAKIQIKSTIGKEFTCTCDWAVSTMNNNYQICDGWDFCGEYDTPEQVIDVITALSDAIKRGETQFSFPTVEELNTPPTVPAIDKAHIEGPITVKAIGEACATINAAAPEGWEVSYDTESKFFLVEFNGKLITTLDSLALTKILPPDKFFDQFRPLVGNDYTPRQQFLDDRHRELKQLTEMRKALIERGGQSKILDGLIDQIKRDILDDELYGNDKPPEPPPAVEFDEHGNITAIWF